jgi:hypothetical protein
MISHGCSSIKYEYCLLNYFVSSLYPLPNSTLPNGEVQVTIWLFCKINFTGLSIHFAKSQSQQFPIVKSMLPSQHSQATNSTPPRQHCKIVKSKFALWTAHSIKISGLSNFWKFSGLLKLLPNKIRPFQNSNYPLN